MLTRRPRLVPLALCSLVSVSVGASAGCAMDLPEQGLIVSHRVLAVRTAVTIPLVPDPNPDVELLTPKAEALPFETVEITPFIVNPDGPVDPDSLDVIWIACQLSPGQGLFACIDAALPLTLADLPECGTPSIADLMDEELVEPESPCVIAREGTPEYVVPFSSNVFIGGSIELTMIAGVPDGTPTDQCARELLDDEYDLPDDCLFAVQRLDVGPVEQLLVLADMFGVDLGDVEVPDPEDVPAADRNPRITEIRVGAVADGEQVGDAVIIESGDLLATTLGTTLQVEVDSPEQDLQTYLIPVNNGESYEEGREAYDGSWFRSWGTLLSDSSDDPSSYNQWNLVPGDQDETETPPSDRARMYYVVRDGRQGVNWFWFDLQVDPAESAEP